MGLWEFRDFLPLQQLQIQLGWGGSCSSPAGDGEEGKGKEKKKKKQKLLCGNNQLVFFFFFPSQIQGKVSYWVNSQLWGVPGAAGPDPCVGNSDSQGLVPHILEWIPSSGWNIPNPWGINPALGVFPAPQSHLDFHWKAAPGSSLNKARMENCSWEFCGSNPGYFHGFLQGVHPYHLPRPNPTGRSTPNPSASSSRPQNPFSLGWEGADPTPSAGSGSELSQGDVGPEIHTGFAINPQ